jgi:hypothetical protein
LSLRRALALVLALSVPAAAACNRRTGAAKRTPPIAGDSIWFSDGVGAGDAAIGDALAQFRFAAAYVPARRLEAGSTGAGIDLPPPPRPLTRVPVVLVVSASENPLADADEKRGKEFGGVLAREIAATLARGGAFGAVRGVHLDVPFDGASAQAHAAALKEARARLSHLLGRSEKAAGPPGRDVPITISIRKPPPADEAEKKAVRALVSRSDGIVAFLFGDVGDAADPDFVDSLGKPWWAAYGSATRGVMRRSSGDAGQPIDEGALDPLTDDPRTELVHEVPWRQQRGAEFTLRAARPLALPGATLAAGDSAVFSQPSLAELVDRFGKDTSRRQFARGRVVVVGGASDTGRHFPVAAIADVIAGRPPVAELRGSTVAEGGRLVRIGAENPTPHGSVVSREQNWIEVDLSPARVGDVELGGFERWEAYDERGRPVTPGRATRVRLYETYLAPYEQLEPARLRVRGRLPGECCRMRTHVTSAAGREVGTDWGMSSEAGAAAKPTASP